jgi:hypothetical protein
MKKILLSFLATILFICTSLIADKVVAQDVTLLLPPQTDGGMPLMKALKNRKTSREFSGKGHLFPTTFKPALGCMWDKSGRMRKKRTAPSAMNYQEVDVYMCYCQRLYFSIILKSITLCGNPQR